MRRFILIVVPVILIGIVSLALVGRKGRPENTDNSNLGTDSVNANISTEPNGRVSNTNGTPVATRDQLLAVSRTFAERFGSTSSVQPSAHLSAAFPFASRALQQAFQRIIDRPPAASDTTVITTSRAHAFSVRSLDEKSGRAEVVVSLQRSERVSDKPATSYTHDLTLQLVKEDGSWKVNAAVWGTKQGAP